MFSPVVPIVQAGLPAALAALVPVVELSKAVVEFLIYKYEYEYEYEYECMSIQTCFTWA